jgi:hypothetical protein
MPARLRAASPARRFEHVPQAKSRHGHARAHGALKKILRRSVARQPCVPPYAGHGNAFPTLSRFHPRTREFEGRINTRRMTGESCASSTPGAHHDLPNSSKCPEKRVKSF